MHSRTTLAWPMRTAAAFRAPLVSLVVPAATRREIRTAASSATRTCDQLAQQLQQRTQSRDGSAAAGTAAVVEVEVEVRSTTGGLDGTSGQAPSTALDGMPSVIRAHGGTAMASSSCRT
jgi:hypothetical protein